MALSTYRPRTSRYRNVWSFRFPSYFECCVMEAPASRKVHAALRFRNSCKFSPCNHNAGTADQRYDPKQAFSTHTGVNNVIKGLGYSRNRRVSGQRLRLLFPQISMSADRDVLAFRKRGHFCSPLRKNGRRMSAVERRGFCTSEKDFRLPDKQRKAGGLAAKDNL